MTTTVEHVQVRRLDEVFSEIVKGLDNPRVYLKIDTQGWDLEVLAGATACLDHIVADLRRHAPLESTFAAFAARGFRVVGMFALGPSPVDGLLNEFDCVMVRRPDSQARPHSGLDGG
jgi:hypothetical protein